MTLEDPFFVVKDEVFKALNKTRGLYLRWIELQEDSGSITKDEVDWTNTELKNSLRSIEWDLEDLEDTIDIVEKNPNKFKIDNKELTTRKHFIDNTRVEVKSMKDKISMNRIKDKDRTARQPLLEQSPVRVLPLTGIGSSSGGGQHGTTRYSKLENELDSPQRQFQPNHHNAHAQRDSMLRAQDDQLEAIGAGLGQLKTVSRGIGVEIDEQAGMLEEFGAEMDHTESKLDATMKKVGKVLHLSNDRRQWTAIIVLSVVLLIVIFLFAIL